MLALDGPARRWEPKRVRLRMFSSAGRLVHGGRRLRLRLAASWPWAHELTAAITRLQARTWLTSRNHPATRKDTRGPWNPAYPARQPGSQPRPHTEKGAAAASARTQDHERWRLTGVSCVFRAPRLWRRRLWPRRIISMTDQRPAQWSHSLTDPIWINPAI